jgi:hypothetical protein
MKRVALLLGTTGAMLLGWVMYQGVGGHRACVQASESRMDAAEYQYRQVRRCHFSEHLRHNWGTPQ